MASIVVAVEVVAGRAHPATLEVLGLARRLGTRLGATVYAVLACVDATAEGAVLASLSRGGADKVLMLAAASHAGPLRWSAHGPAIAAACQLVRPVLVLVAATHGGRDLCARLAARLGAACAMDATLGGEGEGLFILEGDGDETRALVDEPEGDLDFATVAAIAPGRATPAFSDEEAEAQMIEAPPPERGFELAVGDEVRALDPGRPPCAAVLPGDEAAHEPLAVALGAAPFARIAPPLVLAEECGVLARAPGATRVAFGPDAAACDRAHYATADDAAEIARAISAAAAAPRR